MKLLPDAIKVFLFNRLLEAGGIVLIALSIFILISISSYSSYDPNIYNLSNYEVNLGGYIGANISEILLQFFGNGSYLICIIFLVGRTNYFFPEFRIICSECFLY